MLQTRKELIYEKVIKFCELRGVGTLGFSGGREARKAGCQASIGERSSLNTKFFSCIRKFISVLSPRERVRERVVFESPEVKRSVRQADIGVQNPRKNKFLPLSWNERITKLKKSTCKVSKKCYTSDMIHRRSFAFTLAEGATRVALPNSQRRAAFTLAEVLITLGIIGVVAAMTMPSLINKTQNKQLETAFKVAYSTLSQGVLNMLEADGSGLKKYYTQQELDENGNFVSYSNSDEFYEKFYKYSKLKVIGKCNYTGKIMNYNRTAEAYTARTATSNAKDNFPDELSNGMCLSIYINAGQIYISADVNGTKNPNRLGYDIFYLDINNNDMLEPQKMSKLYTEEELKDMSNSFVAGIPCSANSKQAGNGVGCAYYALIDRNPDDNTKGYWESLP